MVVVVVVVVVVKSKGNPDPKMAERFRLRIYFINCPDPFFKGLSLLNFGGVQCKANLYARGPLCPYNLGKSLGKWCRIPEQLL